MERSIFDRTGPTEKSGPPREVGQFSRTFPGWTEPIHSVLPRNFRKFWLNGSRPNFSLIPMRCLLTVDSEMDSFLFRSLAEDLLACF